MRPIQAKFQLGKNGLTQGVIDSLLLIFKNHKTIRISVLKSATRDREEIKSITEEILVRLPFKCNYRIIGFTIILFKKA